MTSSVNNIGTLTDLLKEIYEKLTLGLCGCKKKGPLLFFKATTHMCMAL